MLLIDDDSATGRAFARILGRIGIDVQVATSGREAIARARHGGLDLLLVDLRLPDISGLDVVEALHREQIRIPFLIVSGFATAPDVVRAMKLGAIDVLDKPIDGGALIAAVEAALEIPSTGRVETQPKTQRSAYKSPPPLARRIAAIIRENPQPRSAAERWALYVLRACAADRDRRTLTEWARFVGVSYRSLRERCYLVGIRPHTACSFARMLRAVYLSGDRHIVDSLDVADGRTLKSLMRQAGPQTSNPQSADAISHFLSHQTFIPADNPGIVALRSLIESIDDV